MLWAFTSGTQHVTFCSLPVTATAMVPSWPAARKWKLSGVLVRARRGGAVVGGSTGPITTPRR